MICIVRVQVDYYAKQIISSIEKKKKKKKERKEERENSRHLVYVWILSERNYFLCVSYLPLSVSSGRSNIESCVFSSLSLNNQALVIQKRKIHVIISCFIARAHNDRTRLISTRKMYRKNCRRCLQFPANKKYHFFSRFMPFFYIFSIRVQLLRIPTSNDISCVSNIVDFYRIRILRPELLYAHVYI